MDERDDVRTEMLRFLQGDDARAAARAELRRRGLDLLDPDDLLNDVALRVLRAELPADLANPIAYARRALTFRAADLLRGDRARGRHLAPPPPRHDDEDDDLLADVAEPDAVDPAMEATTAAVEDGLRRALHVRLGAARVKVWAVAAALTALTLRMHPDVAVPSDAPEPDPATPAQRDRWAALWLAGEEQVFPDPDEGREDDPARRQARSRRLREVDDLLRSVAATALGGDHRG